MKDRTVSASEHGSASEEQARQKGLSALAQSVDDVDDEMVEVNILLNGIAFELRKLYDDLLLVQFAVSKGNTFDGLSGATRDDFVSVQNLDRCTQAAECLAYLMKRLSDCYPDRLLYSHVKEAVHLGDIRARLLDREISATPAKELESCPSPKAGDISWL